MLDPLRLLWKRLPWDACGIEIGAHDDPVKALKPYYVERDALYNGRAGRQDVQADGGLLPLRTGELDYLCASHVLEHVPDVIATLLEWWRVLRPGGLLYLVVPDKRFTFDRSRVSTPPEHFLADFRAGVTTADADHIRDFVFGVDWRKMVGELPGDEEARDRQRHFENFSARAAAGEVVDIHYHVFEAASLAGLLEQFGFVSGWRPLFRRLSQAEKFPGHRGDGIGLLLQKTGGRTLPADAPTYLLQTADKNCRPLPLVCPATLAPLELRETATGGELATRDGAGRYGISGNVPRLVVAAGAPVRRPWRDPAWRERVLGAARWRRTGIMRQGL